MREAGEGEDFSIEVVSAAGVLDLLPCPCAIVEWGGHVIHVNDRWLDEASARPDDPLACEPGDNLLHRLDAHDERGLATAIRAVLDLSPTPTTEDLVTPERRVRRVSVGPLAGTGVLLSVWTAPAPAATDAGDLWANLRQRLRWAAETSAGSASFAVAVIDLSLPGDRQPPPELAAVVAERVARGCRPGDLVVPTRAGELFVLLANVLGEVHAIGIAERLLDVAVMPVLLDDVTYELDGTVGVVGVSRLDPADDDDVVREQVRQLAASRQIRHRTRRPVQPEAVGHSSGTEIDRALRAGEFVVHYQPVVSSATRRAIGVEALVRWADPHRGLVPPGEFIARAERTGRIAALGAWVLQQACATAAGLGPDVEVAVNVSPGQIRSSFEDAVLGALDATGLAPQRLCLEITESLVMADPSRAVAVLGSLTSQGVRLALDDFGVGYSSLSRLRDFVIHRLKVDQSFVAGLPKSTLDLRIVGAIVKLAHALELDVVAEGVETEEQFAALVELGCDSVQGYLFGRPSPGLPEFG